MGADGAEVGGRYGNPARGTTPTGFFTKSGTERGRTRLREKMDPFLKLLDTARSIVQARLIDGGLLAKT